MKNMNLVTIYAVLSEISANLTYSLSLLFGSIFLWH